MTLTIFLSLADLGSMWSPLLVTLVSVGAPHCLSLFFIFVLPIVVPLSPAELLDDQHPVVRLLRTLSSDCPRGWPVSLDATLAHHLHQCSYHLRLFRNWLRSGQDDPECLYGTPATGWLPPLPRLGLIALLTAFLAGEPF